MWRSLTRTKTTATLRSCAATRSKTSSLNQGRETVLDISLAAQAETASQPHRRRNDAKTSDRWRLRFPEYDRYGDRGARGRDIPFKKGRWWDPYNQNVLKGDYPIKGDKLFMILTAVSSTSVEQRRAPTPSDVSSVDPGSAEFFGRPEQFAAAETLQFSFELFHGDTVFKPRDWAIKFSPTFSIPNYLDARENGVVNIDVRRGTNRTDWHASLEEAFGEVKLADVNANYDFVSVRAGIQPFVSDFRGFIFSDNNLGARVFGAFDNNRVQFNAAYFSMLEKDTNSGLNRFDTRHQNVYIANIFRQDFIRKGYTIQGSFHYNDDRRSSRIRSQRFSGPSRADRRRAAARDQSRLPGIQRRRAPGPSESFAFLLLRLWTRRAQSDRRAANRRAIAPRCGRGVGRSGLSSFQEARSSSRKATAMRRTIAVQDLTRSSTIRILLAGSFRSGCEMEFV